jgi:2-polyprenyl-6-methoxyphenol hydroxylase-like FAD-dependent oxidoreductase
LKVLIVGAGIGGLTAAIALRKTGIEAHVYERAPELREVGAGIALASNALRALDTLGIGPEIRSQGVAGIQGALRNPAGEAIMAIPSDEFARQVGGLVVLHRAELLALLERQLDPQQLHLGRECIGLERDARNVTVRFQNGETATGDVLIGADGVRSAIRTELFGARPLRYAGYTAWRSVVKAGETGNVAITETWGRGCRFGIVPMSAGRIYWFATHNAPQSQREPQGQTKNTLAQLFQGWHQPIKALIGASTEDSILKNDIYDMDPLPRWVDGRVALLGDAAHPMTPNLGQGACQAIEDAVVLAACLKKSDDHVERALLEFERRRIPRARTIVLSSRRLGVVAQLETPVSCRIRDVAMRATPKRLAMRQMKALSGFEVLSVSERALFSG